MLNSLVIFLTKFFKEFNNLYSKIEDFFFEIIKYNSIKSAETFYLMIIFHIKYQNNWSSK